MRALHWLRRRSRRPPEASLAPRRGGYRPGDRVLIADGDDWLSATVEKRGDPVESVPMRSAGVTRMADVVWVRCEHEDAVRRYPHALIRPLLPGS